MDDILKKRKRDQDDNNNNNDNNDDRVKSDDHHHASTATTLTFKSLIGSTYIRHCIFNHVYVNRRDIINSSHLGMISKYAMPWNFIKHYLPSRANVTLEARMRVIREFCCHRNATTDTLSQILDWSIDYDPRASENGDLETVKLLLTLNDEISGRFRDVLLDEEWDIYEKEEVIRNYQQWEEDIVYYQQHFDEINRQHQLEPSKW
ncbi:hypothetical protein DFA_04148 [Cavenderia fasciculata]|uniref:Uncharacterized protein n=1 Tax=Cavenderia fasciculata TaxID=261658 RepID=F4Q1F2_CACFS|nr:uncharacterized protein DFA_04148 [Cavenderia fasciculata]EGG18653.1 hypothetical protein DFA_04148 [Cavenderia fasciculata]|eukprot:XP_004366557.1 hypothetical protein DFA_04148 [Cavenderia fasciculata]